MRRVQTSEDLSREEYEVLQRGNLALVDPMKDPLMPFKEKQRLAALWQAIKQQNTVQSRLSELLGPLMTANAHKTASSVNPKLPVPLSSGLQIACLSGDLNLVKMLVARGEDIDAVTMSPDNFGRSRSPISIATEMGHKEILEFLIASGGDVRNIHDPPLRQAVRKNNGEICKMLVDAGADPDPTLHQLLTPRTDASTVEMLLKAGASPCGTMLLTALWRGCSSAIIKLFLDAGAPVRVDLENHSALEVATCCGASEEVINMLISANAKWSPRRNKLYPKRFRNRIKALLLVNRRAPTPLPPTATNRIVAWVAVAEKREADLYDLRKTACFKFSKAAIESRLAYFGWKFSSFPSKYAALSGLSASQLKTLIWHKEKTVGNSGNRLLSLDSAESESDLDIATPAPVKKVRKQKSRQQVHPVSSNNPNTPKAHHCTCCHVCHVSMKQRPRPTAACSQCNTIICKLCLQERWKVDQWETACETAEWVCHKCCGSCVCKSCRAKGEKKNYLMGKRGYQGDGNPKLHKKHKKRKTKQLF